MSLWGNAWGFAWGNAWGAVVNPKPEPGMAVIEPAEMRNVFESVESRLVRQPLSISFTPEQLVNTFLVEYPENRNIRS